MVTLYMIVSRASGQEQPVSRIVRLILVGIPQPGKEALKCRHLRRWHLETHQYTAKISAMIPIMEQADIPTCAHALEKLHQRTRPFRKLEPIDQLMEHTKRFRRMTT